MENKKYFLVLAMAAFALIILAYFSLSGLGKYVTGSAVINPPFSVSAWSIKTSEVAIKLGNNEQEDYNIQSVSVEGCGVYKTPTAIESGTKATIVTACSPSLTEGDLFKGGVTLIYRKSGSKTDLTSAGTIEGKVR